MDEYYKYGASETEDKQRSKVKHKNDYIELGFIAIATVDIQIALLVDCKKKFEN